MNKDKLIVIIAIVAIILSFYMMLDSYGRLNMALDMCVNNVGGGIFG